MREVPPGFVFYVRDWRSSRGVAGMRPVVRALYLEMLIEQWDKGSAPGTPEECAAQLGLDRVRTWRRAWPLLVANFERLDDGRLVNVKLDEQRRDRAAYYRQQRALGHLGGTARAARMSASQPEASHEPATSQPRASHEPATSQPRASQNKTENIKQSAHIGQATLQTRAKPSKQRKDKQVQIQEQRSTTALSFPHAELARDRAAREPAVDGNFRVIERLAYAVLRSGRCSAYGDCIEAIKTACARARIAYDGDVTHRALDSAAHRLGFTFAGVGTL